MPEYLIRTARTHELPGGWSSGEASLGPPGCGWPEALRGGRPFVGIDERHRWTYLKESSHRLL
jgi:hypothetical protein